MNKKAGHTRKNTIAYAVGIVLMFAGCATNKNGPLRRGWHNMNARYNGYFYSRESMKESIKKVDKANKDDFSQIIPIFIYPTNETAKGYYSDFDKSIKKSSTVIQRHCITDKHKVEIANACKWIDENYMLIGRSHFYKRDFFSALEAFEYVAKKYPNPAAKYGAMLWMIRTNNEIGSLSQSEPIIDELRNATDVPQDRAFQCEMFAVTADYYMKREDYPPAIKNLTRAIALTKSKKTKARYTYVLAQLYEQRGDNKKASEFYGMVPGLHPISYDMEFNAQINRAKLYDISAGSDVIKKKLNKMLKDDKNIEFQDQIFYTLADIAYREKNIPLAMVDLDKSIRVSTSNNTQKALSYLKRADIHFDKIEYPEAEANYDSTMSFLPKTYPNYNLISEKKKSLTALVQNLKIIKLEDSLQVLAKMSENDRNATIDKMIVKIEAEEKKKEEDRLNEQNNPTLNTAANGGSTSSTATNTGAWYFYNPATVGFGTGEFTKKWGSRKNEDNWRRSQKEQVLAVNPDDNSDAGADSTNTGAKLTSLNGSKNNKKDRSFYLKSIPLTADALEKSTGKIVEAYYNVGSIYKEQLLNNQKSNEAFEELLSRFPDNKYKLSCYYQLYRTYLSMNDEPKSDYYKNLLLDKYPDTEYAKIIKNPDFAKDIAASKSIVEKFYAETFQYYTDAKYPEALANCLKADSSYAKSPLMPRFSFIKALCIGRTQDIGAFETALVNVTLKYPKDPVKDRAQEMLEMIKKQKNPDPVVNSTKDSTTSTTSDTTKTKAKFAFTESGEYFWVAIVDNGKGDITKFKTALSDENTQSFSLQDLTVNSVFLDMNHQLISVKTFDGKQKAMNYYNYMKDNKDAFKDLQVGTYQTFVISSDNYSIFYRDKNVEEYKTFFTQNYK